MWGVTPISISEQGVVLQCDNGDTQWLSWEEYESFLEKRGDIYPAKKP